MFKPFESALRIERNDREMLAVDVYRKNGAHVARKEFPKFVDRSNTILGAGWMK